MKPVLLVIAGPNGAGKTTVTARLRSDHWSQGVEYLNPDEVARDRFGDWNSPQAVLDAARRVTARREELLTQGAGIAFETVFSAPDKVDFVARYGPLPAWVESAIGALPRHAAFVDLRAA